MKTIWKYQLDVGVEAYVQIPVGAVVMGCGAEPRPGAWQTQMVCVWALVDPTEESRDWHLFHILGTGTPVPDNAAFRTARFLGTVVTSPFAWHVFHAGICPGQPA